MAQSTLPELKSHEEELATAKGYLQTLSNDSGHNVFDHLVSIVTFMLEARPNNALEMFEQISHNLKRTKMGNSESIELEKLEVDSKVDLAQIQKKLFKKKLPTADLPVEELPEDPKDNEEEVVEDDDEDETPLPDLMHTIYYFEQAGVGMNREEYFRVWMALKQLSKKYSFSKIQFWGKLLGIFQNYYVAQVEFEDEDPEEAEEAEEEEQKEETKEKNSSIKSKLENEEIKSNKTEESYPPVPEIKWKLPKPIPPEPRGRGVNKNVFFVCNEPGKLWTRLPKITPQHITVARQIKVLFTGKLNNEIITFPSFPGEEIHLLAAQIARITAATHISPSGFYEIDEEEEPEEDEIPETLMQAEEFEAPELDDLLDESLENWVHHSLHILQKQGRCQWWDKKKAEDEDEEENEEKEEEEEEEMKEEEDDNDKEDLEPEVGPELLTPIGEDEPIIVPKNGELQNKSQETDQNPNEIPAWSVKISSKLVPKKYAVAIVKSNRWPGAYAFAHGQNFANVYIGDGQKYTGQNYNPPAMPKIMKEYVHPPHKSPLIEQTDPTPEQEAALRARIESIKRRKLATLEAMEENEEEKEVDDEEEGEDDE